MLDLKIIERIKKFLALSSDESTTQHERDLALNRAKDLMAEHSLSYQDLKDKDPKNAIIIEHYMFKGDNPLPTMLADPMLFNVVVQPICNNFGCYTAYETLTRSHIIYGFPENVEIAKYACDVILNQGIKDYRAELKIQRTFNLMINFWIAFASGLHQRFIKITDEKALTLYDKVKDSVQVEATQITLPTSSSTTGWEEGFRSARDAQLNTAIKSGNKGNLLK